MMTQQIGFSVLSAPLAAIDRRALSEAWYSALHLAKGNAAEAPRSKPVKPSGAVHAKAATAPAQRSTADAVHFPPRAAAQQRDRQNEAQLVERRAMRSPLARKIESTFLHPSRSVQRATFTIDGTQNRVHIALQTSGSQLRLIAICPPSVRTAVARALEEARYALAERGITLSAETEAK